MNGFLQLYIFISELPMLCFLEKNSHTSLIVQNKFDLKYFKKLYYYTTKEYNAFTITLLQ